MVAPSRSSGVSPSELVLGALAVSLSVLEKAAPPPLCLAIAPFRVALGDVYLAALAVRFNKVEAAALRARGTEVAEKMADIVYVCSSGLPTGRVEQVSITVHGLAATLREVAEFLQLFAAKGAFSKLVSGTIDARYFEMLDRRLTQLSNELGSALDLQSLAQCPGKPRDFRGRLNDFHHI